ncbi:timeless protein-domain-containing protein [Echria macrotheca]|uniref:Topoisomerase 1-associated factor 1 n=1 Tax=Echria macrotheca TaxID=438768 RepID=A0AAJ0BMJ7_9PEZI|nr:timeless protein-domain-containing protein [Echria macrotheca]
MEAAEVPSNDVVHPEVRAHINSLVSALGGLSIDGDEAYKLGDDALECLRDLKRWIRFYDEKTNRMDVARCLAEANIVGNDLLPILATWPPSASDNTYKARIALACFEIMVPLTWPIEKDRETMTVNHHRHVPVLQLAQVRYKRDIINFDAVPILGAAVRIALPSMALPIGERAARDQGIIKLVLYFLRNIAMITPPPSMRDECDESQISRSTLTDAFTFQDVFLALLTIASNMGEDFKTEDVILMEIIFHLVKRVDPGKLFVTEKQVNKAKTNELVAALSKEEALKRHNKNAPTRHSRFGTMIWVKRESGKLATVTGQEALLDQATRERKMDTSKTFRRPKRRLKNAEMEPKDLGPPANLDERARQQLGSFVSEFLDSGFNPLFSHLRKSIDREEAQVMDYHQRQFFYLVAWFLEAERMRGKARAEQKKAGEDEVRSFNLVAEVLSQDMFILLNRYLDRAYTDHNWLLLSAVMRCLTQILLTVQEMSDSGNEEDEEIADNILSRLFYEETTHDAVANIVRTYADQGFEYLDACTELTHTYLRILEAYSKQNVDLQVRSKKRARRKKKAKAAADNENQVQDDVDGDSADDERNAEKTIQERKFDFKRFTHRFVPQGVVDTFVTFTKYYQELNDDQLKRAHRYFYRVAFKQEMSVMLFRLDIIHLFYNMIKGPEPLDKSSAVYRDWEELAKQIIKKCVRKLEERPALFTELLFSKTNSTAHYLEFGHEKQTVSTNPRPAAELEFKRETSRDQQIAIVVGALLDKGQGDHLAWIKKQLSEAESERRAWENMDKATATAEGESPTRPSASHTTVIPDTDARRTAMFKNPHLRLLMSLVGMQRLAPMLDETRDSIWIVPGSLSSDDLKDTTELINRAEFSPPTFDDGALAEDQLRRKSAAPKKRAAYDDDDSLDEDDGVLFPAGGPTARKATEDGERPKKRIRRRRKDAEGAEEGGVDELLEEKARARREKELEKRRKIKSDVYVHASDDESDDEEYNRWFFAREQAIREKNRASAMGMERGLLAGVLGDGGVESDEDTGAVTRTKESQPGKEKKGKKRGSDVVSSSEVSEEDDDEDESDVPPKRKKNKRASSPPAKQGKNKKKKRKSVAISISEDDEDEEMSSAASVTADADGDGDGDGNEDTNDTSISPVATPPGTKDTQGDVEMDDAEEEQEDEDEDDDVVKQPPHSRMANRRARAGFVMDSSDEE